MKNSNKKPYLETVEETEYQLVPPQPRIENILVVENDIIDNQIIYTQEGESAAIEAILKIYPTAQYVLDIHSEPGDPNKWEVTAWKA